jgi:hypothetical protein
VEAETVDCTVVSPPATIGSQGVYCLKGNAVVSLTSGQAILINASNVVLDLNGWVIRNNVAAGTDDSGSAGIVFGADRRRATVRNGTIQGFGNGISFRFPIGDAPTGDVIEDLRIVNSKRVGINLHSGKGDLIQRNLILNTGEAAAPAGTNVFGINAGFMATVQSNDVVTVTPGAGIAAGLSAGSDSVLLNNRIKDVDGSGIFCQPSANARLRDNIVVGVTGSAFEGDCFLLANNF